MGSDATYVEVAVQLGNVTGGPLKTMAAQIVSPRYASGHAASAADRW
jgi:hypothetical protein